MLRANQGPLKRKQFKQKRGPCLYYLYSTVFNGTDRLEFRRFQQCCGGVKRLTCLLLTAKRVSFCWLNPFGNKWGRGAKSKVYLSLNAVRECQIDEMNFYQNVVEHDILVSARRVLTYVHLKQQQQNKTNPKTTFGKQLIKETSHDPFITKNIPKKSNSRPPK